LAFFSRFCRKAQATFLPLRAADFFWLLFFPSSAVGGLSRFFTGVPILPFFVD
jgi:hypothetical protein